jgi:hypothetical protein
LIVFVYPGKLIVVESEANLFVKLPQCAINRSLAKVKGTARDRPLATQMTTLRSECDEIPRNLELVYVAH